MRKAAELLRKMIVQVDTGICVGKVEDLLLDPEEKRLVALITMSGRWMRAAALIPWEQIVVSTGDVILVRPGTEPQLARDIPRLHQLIERNIHLSGTPVLTASGKKLGAVGELLINADGQIEGYAVNRGFLRAERTFVSADDVEVVGADAVIVKHEQQPDLPADQEAVDFAETLRHSIVLPLTGSRIIVDAPAERQSDSDPPSLPAPAAEAPESAAPPRAPAEEAPAADESPPAPATGATIHLERQPAEGEPPPPIDAGRHSRRLSEAEIDAIVRGEQPIPEE